MNKFTDDQWLDIFQQCKASGISDQQWCRENHIASSTFYYHLRKLRAKAPEAAIGSKDPQPECHEVVPLIVRDDAGPSPAETGDPSIRISISDIRIDVFAKADSSLIAETLLAVKRVC